MREGKRLAESRGPILVGPWLSEVGYEVLYWVPFLAWFLKEFQIPSSRLWCFSRGGSALWYRNFSENYLDIFELMTPEEYRQANEARWAERKGAQKQKGVSLFDRALMEKAQRHLDWEQFELLHPSVMYTSLRHFWKGSMGSNWLETHTRFAPLSTTTLSQTRETLGLPESYLAVKIYFNASFPRTSENERFCRLLLKRLSQKLPVVLLDTGLKVDDHEELSGGRDGIISLREKWHPVKNLEQQTAVVAGAESFYGTYGGFSYLGPFLNVPSISFYSNPEHFFHGHLHAAQLAVRSLRGVLPRADFSALQVKTLEALLEESQSRPSLATSKVLEVTC